MSWCLLLASKVVRSSFRNSCNKSKNNVYIFLLYCFLKGGNPCFFSSGPSIVFSCHFLSTLPGDLSFFHRYLVLEPWTPRPHHHSRLDSTWILGIDVRRPPQATGHKPSSTPTEASQVPVSRHLLQSHLATSAFTSSCHGGSASDTGHLSLLSFPFVPDRLLAGALGLSPPWPSRRTPSSARRI